MATTFKVGDTVEVRHNDRVAGCMGTGPTTVSKVTKTRVFINAADNNIGWWNFNLDGSANDTTMFTIHLVTAKPADPVTHTTDADGDKWTVNSTGRFVRVNNKGQFTVKDSNTIKRYNSLTEALAIASQGDWTLVREGNSPSGLPMKLFAGPQGFRLESESKYVEAATLEDLLFTPQVSK